MEIPLPPVLYHGTAKYLIDQTLKLNRSLSRLSLTPDPTFAAQYASYRVTQNYEWHIQIENDLNRHLQVHLGLSDGVDPAEIKKLKKGEVNSSLLIFDRDTILHRLKQDPNIDIFSDDFGTSVQLSISRADFFVYPSEALIASLDYRSGGRRTRSLSIHTRIFNPYLWEDNFCVRPPEKTIKQALPELTYTPLYFSMFIQALFLGTNT